VSASSASSAGASAVSATRALAATPSGEEMPVGDLPGWHQVFSDDFTTTVPLGSFPAAVASKWIAYPSPWKDTSGYGTYSPSTVVSVNGGLLNQDIHTGNGVAMVSALRPQVGTMTYGRYAVRYRFDSLKGYKMAFMLWPDSNDGHGEGEIDFPEMNLDATSAWGFVHRTDSTGPDDQAWFNTPLAAGSWHTAVIEWSPNLVVFLRDGVEVGRTALRTPTTPMHWVMQTETSVNLTAPPDASVQGNVQVDWASVWTYDPSTGDATAPVVALTTPTDGATAAANQTLEATATDAKGVLGVQFQVDGANVGAEDLVAPYTTAWNSALATTGTHTVTAIARDNAGNQGSATASVTVDNTQDLIAPKVLSSVPQLNGTIFPVGANLNAQFSEAVTGVTTTSMTLKNVVTGATIPGSVVYTLNANQSIAVMNPTNPLTADTKYTVSLTGAIKDPAGNPLVATSWSFVTGPAPTATPTTPVANSTNVSRPTTIIATASEDLTKVGSTTVLVKTAAGTQITGTITFNTANDTITFAPTAPLAAATKYTVTLTNGIKDLAGNPLSTTTWSFTTGA
jgi:hypothetical protein